MTMLLPPPLSYPVMLRKVCWLLFALSTLELTTAAASAFLQQPFGRQGLLPNQLETASPTSAPLTLLEAKPQKKKSRAKSPSSGLGFAKQSPRWGPNEPLKKWLIERGADLNNVSVGVVDSGTGLRGVTAAKDLKEGDVIFSISREKCSLDEGRADQSPIAAAIYPSSKKRDALPACVRVALYLLWLEVMPLEKAKWEPVLAALPKPEDFLNDGGPMELWSEEEVELVECGQLIAEVRSRAVELRAHYDERVRPCWLQESASDGLLSGLDVPSFEEFQHAVCVVTSRAYGDGDAGCGTSSMLIPGVDLCNHADAGLQNTKHGLAPWGDFIVYAGQSIRKGEEVLVSYGPLPNRLLLAQFGFLLPGPLVSDTALVRLDGLFPATGDEGGHAEASGGVPYNGPATAVSEAHAEALWAAGPGPGALEAAALPAARRSPATGRLARWQAATVSRAAAEALARAPGGSPGSASGGGGGGKEEEAEGAAAAARRVFRGLLERELAARSPGAGEGDAREFELELTGPGGGGGGGGGGGPGAAGRRPPLPARQALALRFRAQARRLLEEEMEALAAEPAGRPRG